VTETTENSLHAAAVIASEEGEGGQGQRRRKMGTKDGRGEERER